MATGKALGEFSLKAITATYSPGPAGGVLSQVNWEGTATGFGTVFGTRTEGFMQLSDGRRIAGDGEIDLAARSWKGKLSEIS